MPIISPSVNSEFISGWPHSVSCLAEVPVDVQRLRIERHVGEQHVVHLRHRAGVAVLVGLADLEILEIEPAALVPLDRLRHRYPPKSCQNRALRTRLRFIYHNSPWSAGPREPLRPRLAPISRRTLQGATTMADSPGNSRRRPQITGAIRQAAQSTGISFEYLLTTAQIESNLNPAAQASTSSAKGLYQFIDQTWLATMKQAGPALGLGQLCRRHHRAADGHYEVPDPAMRAAIMRLRSDPQASAMMAGAFTRNNADTGQLRRSAGSRAKANSISRISSAPTAPAS